MSIATLFLWCGTLLVTLTFLSLVRALTRRAPPALCRHLYPAFLFVKLAVPETRSAAWRRSKAGGWLAQQRLGIAMHERER